MPPTHRGGGEHGDMLLHEKPAAALVGKAATASFGGDMLRKKVAALSIGGVPTMHRPTGSIGSTWEMLQKKEAAAESSRGSPTARPRRVSHNKGAAGGSPTAHPSKGAVFTGSGGKVPQKKAAFLRGGGGGGSPHGGKDAPSRLRSLGAPALGSLTNVIDNIGHTVPSSGVLHGNTTSQECKEYAPRMAKHHSQQKKTPQGLKEKGNTGLGGQMLHNYCAQEVGTSASMDTYNGSTTAKDSKKSAAKHHTVSSVSRAKMPQKVDTSGMGLSGGGMLRTKSSKVEADTGLSGGGMLRKKSSKLVADTGLSGGGMLRSKSSKLVADTGLSGGGLLRKKSSKVVAHTGLSGGGMLKKKSSKDTGLSGGGMLRKKSSKVEADTGLSGGGLLRKKSSKVEADSNKITHVTVDNAGLEEAKLLIQQLNELDRGEYISREDFRQYYDQLPPPQPWIDTDVQLEDEKLDEQDLLHARYRFRYCKHKLSHKVPEKELRGDILEEGYTLYHLDERLKEDDLQDISEEGCSVEFLKKQGYFKHFEKDGTLDWVFHPNYLDCDLLNDYQRLVLRNYGGTEYARWSEYHQYLHSYRIEREYVNYCEVLSKELEWMKDYIHFPRPSFKWDHISSRGALQAVKIAATGFTEISASLAYSGYYECIESMSYDHVWFNELDGVYFEIWLRVTEGLSFKDALVEVHHLNKFPLRQRMMERALEFDESMEKMEEQYRTCTAGITSKEQALKSIGEAVKKLVNKPKSYEQYIRKKIDIARIIGIPLVD